MTERSANPMRSLYGAPDTPEAGIGADGIYRTAAAEKALNLNFSELFRGDRGKTVLDYLKSITINQVNGPRVTDGELRHMEGQRFTVALIERRIAHGNDSLPNAGPKPQPVANAKPDAEPHANPIRRRRNAA